MQTGKCPKCEKVMPHIGAEGIDVQQGRTAYAGVAYKCPLCHTVLNVELEPFATMDEIAKRVAAKLKR